MWKLRGEVKSLLQRSHEKERYFSYINCFFSIAWAAIAAQKKSFAGSIYKLDENMKTSRNGEKRKIDFFQRPARESFKRSSLFFLSVLLLMRYFYFQEH